MTSVRQRTCAAGAALAVVAGALVDHAAFFGSDFGRSALLGVVMGAVVGLVPHRSPLLRLTGFAAGLVAAWAGYLVRAGMLPDIPMGRAIAAVLVVSLITAVSTATADRVPLWAGLLGAGTLVGAFEQTYVQAPSDVVGGSTVAVTSAVLAVAFGFLVTNLLSSWAPARQVSPAAHAADATPSAPEPTVKVDGSTPVPGPRVTTDAPTTSEISR